VSLDPERDWLKRQFALENERRTDMERLRWLAQRLRAKYGIVYDGGRFREIVR